MDVSALVKGTGVHDSSSLCALDEEVDLRHGGRVPSTRLRSKTRVSAVGDPAGEPAGGASDDEHAPVEDPDVGDLPPVRSRRPDPMPSESQRFRHSITHIPFQSWCPVCVSARGRSDQHRSTSQRTTGIPLVAFDYGFFREGRGMTNVPVLVAVGKDSGCLGAIA